MVKDEHQNFEKFWKFLEILKIFKNSENFITDDDFECNLYINTFDIKQLKLTSSSPLWPFSVIINCTWRGIISKQKLRFSKIFKKF